MVLVIIILYNSLSLFVVFHFVILFILSFIIFCCYFPKIIKPFPFCMVKKLLFEIASKYSKSVVGCKMSLADYIEPCFQSQRYYIIIVITGLNQGWWNRLNFYGSGSRARFSKLPSSDSGS